MIKKIGLIVLIGLVMAGCGNVEDKFHPEGWIATKYMEVMNKGGIDMYPDYENGISMDDFVIGLHEKLTKILNRIEFLEGGEAVYIGEVYIHDYGLVEPNWQWIKFTEDNIKDRVDGYVKIGIYESRSNWYYKKWFKNEDIIWYQDQYKKQKEEIEKRIKKEIK